MTLAGPLSIRLRTSLRDIYITKQVSDVEYSSTSPGGYEACVVNLHRPLRFMPQEVMQFGRMYVYGSTGVAWEGRLQDPGRSAGADGEVYQLTAVGGQAHLQDNNVPLIYVDRDMTKWVKARSAVGEMQSTQVQASETPSDGSPAIVCSFPAGLTVPTSASCSAVYYGLQAAGQNLAVFDYSWDAGITNGSWELRALSSSSHQIRMNTANTSGGGASSAVVGVTTNFVIGDNLPYLRFVWNSAPSGTGGSDAVWAAFKSVVLRATTYNLDGTEKTSGYVGADQKILASTVVADLLGRLLFSVYDSINASITTTSYLIDQLAYPDGVNPLKVLEDLLTIEAAYTYHVWQSNLANDKFTFEWLPWPTTPRYEASVRDGFSSSSSGNTIYDQVRVRYRNARGLQQHVLRTQNVQALTDAGFHRTWFIDQGDEVGSAATAAQAGDQFLADHALPANAGQLLVAHPILDLQEGRMVMPHELRAGSLIRVKGVESYTDALNPNGRDGLTIFRIASAHYSSATATATLDLDSYTPTVARALAALRRPPVIRRR